MKSTVLARPNIRLLLCAAGFVLVVAQLFMPDNAQPMMVAHARSNPQAAERSLQVLLRKAATHPNPDLYRQISRIYEDRGDLHKALQYLRWAGLLSDPDGD